MFILQILSVCRTKRSRAAPLAGIRNRLPRALPLPDTVLDCEYGCHSQHHQESCSEDGTAVFLAGQPECKIWQALPVKLNGGFEFARQADHIDIYFTDQRGRRQVRRKLFALAKGQTAQLRINGRACGFDDTYYTQHTYNFAHADNVPREIFTQRGFDYSVSLENHLF